MAKYAMAKYAELETRAEMEVDYFLQNINDPEILHTVGMAFPPNLQTQAAHESVIMPNHSFKSRNRYLFLTRASDDNFIPTLYFNWPTKIT